MNEIDSLKRLLGEKMMSMIDEGDNIRPAATIDIPTPIQPNRCFSSTHNSSDLISFQSAEETTLVVSTTTTTTRDEHYEHRQEEDTVMESCLSTLIEQQQQTHVVEEQTTHEMSTIVIQRPLHEATTLGADHQFDEEQQFDYRTKYFELRECKCGYGQVFNKKSQKRHNKNPRKVVLTQVLIKKQSHRDSQTSVVCSNKD